MSLHRLSVKYEEFMNCIAQGKKLPFSLCLQHGKRVTVHDLGVGGGLGFHSAPLGVEARPVLWSVDLSW